MDEQIRAPRYAVRRRCDGSTEGEPIGCEQAAGELCPGHDVEVQVDELFPAELRQEGYDGQALRDSDAGRWARAWLDPDRFKVETMIELQTAGYFSMASALEAGRLRLDRVPALMQDCAPGEQRMKVCLYALAAAHGKLLPEDCA